MNPRLEPEHVRSVADRRVVQLTTLARQARARHLDRAVRRCLDRPQLTADVLVARKAAEAEVLVVLDARAPRHGVRRGGRRRDPANAITNPTTSAAVSDFIRCM